MSFCQLVPIRQDWRPQTPGACTTPGVCSRARAVYRTGTNRPQER